MPDIRFTPSAWDEYMALLGEDRKTVQRINRMLKALNRGDSELIGKPEVLRYGYTGKNSLCIDARNRLVYSIHDGYVTVYQLKGHYDD